jgi:UDP-glucose 4-epimerase
LENLIDVINQTSPENVFYLSSALVYGERIIPATEEGVLAPIDEYSRFKCAAESLLKERLKSGIALGILRLANVYGGLKNRGFIGFILQHLSEESTEKIFINGDGGKERDYIFVDDAVAGILAVKKGKKGLKGGDIVNIATGQSYSLNDLVECISRLGGKALPYEVRSSGPVEVIKSRISCEKLRERYDFSSEKSLELGLIETIRRYRTPGSSPSEELDTLSRKIIGLKILFLGGEGFIGRNLATYFSKMNTCFSVGKRKSDFIERTDTFIEADPYKEKIPNGYDVIVHLIDNKVSPDLLIEEENRLAGNVDFNAKNHLIIFSSAVVYANPDSEYGRRKIALEKFYVEYCKKRNIALTIFRTFNVFGPFQIPYRQGGLIANLLYNFLNKKRTEINDIHAQRDFIYSKDIPKFVEYVLKHRLQGTFDLGSGTLVSIKDVLTLLEEKILQDTINIINTNKKEGLTCPPAKSDILKEISATSFEEGLIEMVKFYKNNMNILKKYVD